MNKLNDITSNLINELINERLLKSDLKDYLDYILNNFEEISSFKNYKDFKNCSTLLGIMLENESFEDNPDVRQLISSIGYFIVSKGISDITENNFANPVLQAAHIELLAVRLQILLGSSGLLRYTMKLFIDKYTSKYSITGDQKYKIETCNDDLLIYDSFTTILFKEKLKPSIKMGALPFLDERIFLLGEKISEIHSSDENLKERYENGKNMHKELYLFLTERFMVHKNYSFE